MRISFKGPSTPSALLREISDLLVDLAELGVDELESVNLYCNLRASGEPVELLSRSGDKVDILAVRGRTVTGYRKEDVGDARSSRSPRRRSVG